MSFETDWYESCQEHGDRLKHERCFYESTKLANNGKADYELCVKEANEGNERAIRYLTGFAKFRMKS